MSKAPWRRQPHRIEQPADHDHADASDQQVTPSARMHSVMGRGFQPLTPPRRPMPKKRPFGVAKEDWPPVVGGMAEQFHCAETDPYGEGVGPQQSQVADKSDIEKSDKCTQDGSQDEADSEAPSLESPASDAPDRVIKARDWYLMQAGIRAMQSVVGEGPTKRRRQD